MFKNQSKDNSKKPELDIQLTLDFIQDEGLLKIITSIYKEIYDRDIDKKREKIHAESNYQENENLDDSLKRQILSFINESHLSGLAHSESNVEFLKEPSNLY